jgi:Tfp pilus assembly protein PilZ
VSEHTPTRRHPRISLRVPVDVTTIDPETDPQTGRPCFRECRELCGNLSQGGMFIATNDPPRPGRRLFVRIHTPDGGPPIEALARVAWQKPGAADAREAGVGIEFVLPSAGTSAAIERALGRAGGGEPRSHER